MIKVARVAPKTTNKSSSKERIMHNVTCNGAAERRPRTQPEPVTRAALRAATRGLTLVELVITITLIGVLTAAISIGVIGAQKRANVSAGKTACSTARQATMQWKAVHPSEDCPTVDQLKTEKDLDTGFNLKDPWGSPYKLSCDADEITCTSAGPDRKEGTDDDIRVPQVDTPTGGK
jgi:general secretion pathway protein G